MSLKVCVTNGLTHNLSLSCVISQNLGSKGISEILHLNEMLQIPESNSRLNHFDDFMAFFGYSG
jgi:hypothetical protein